MNHLEVEFVHLKCKLDSLNLFLEDADQLSQMLHRSAESEQEIMIPLGSYAFIPGKVHPQTNFMISLGAGIWIKMNLEESLNFVAEKKRTFQKEITRITTRMNEISQALEGIKNSGSCLNACGYGIFEIQEQFDHHHQIKDIPLASENERNELKLKLYHQKPVELSESQKKDMQMLEELIQSLEIEDYDECQPENGVQQAIPSSKPLKKVSFNQTVSFLREGHQIGEEPLKDFEKCNVQFPFKPVNLSTSENSTLKSSESKSSESKSNDSDSNALRNSQNSVQSPISNLSFPKKSPISLVVRERTRTAPLEDSTIAVDEDQDEASILMKQVKSEYVAMKNRRATREQSREFYTSPFTAQESSSGSSPARRSRFSKVLHENTSNKLSDHVFDYVIQGTGLFESILACALSKAGKQVLQLENSTFYGGKSEGTPWNEEQLLQCGILPEHSKNDTIFCKLKFDLGVKFLNAHCPFGQLMIESRIAAHLDFKAIDSILYYCPVAKSFLELPLTKEQIFLSKNLSLVEKRNTMAFLRELSQSSSSPLQDGFRESLSKLPSHLQDALSICIPHQSPEELKEFIRSCGIFSPCPYLYSMFGSVEIAQSFVRLAAVNGAIQMLNAPNLNFHFETSEEDDSSSVFKCITSDENSQLFTTSKCIITKSESKEQIHRAIAFAHEPVLPTNSKAILAFKKIKDAKLTIFQCDHSSMLCPEGLYFHFFECEVDFQSELQEMLQAKNVHFQFAFQVSKESIFDFHQKSIEPLRLENSTNFSHYFLAAQKVFHSIESELEFFPNESSQFHDSE